MKDMPTARCTVCGKATSGATGRHRGLVNGKPCLGEFRSAIKASDWAECTDCGVAGIKDGENCPSCQGAGWLYVRANG